MNRLHLAKNGFFMEIGDIFYWQPAGDQPPDMDVLPDVHPGSIVTCVHVVNRRIVPVVTGSTQPRKYAQRNTKKSLAEAELHARVTETTPGAALGTYSWRPAKMYALPYTLRYVVEQMCIHRGEMRLEGRFLHLSEGGALSRMNKKHIHQGLKFILESDPLWMEHK